MSLMPVYTRRANESAADGGLGILDAAAIEKVRVGAWRSIAPTMWTWVSHHMRDHFFRACVRGILARCAFARRAVFRAVRTEVTLVDTRPRLAERDVSDSVPRNKKRRISASLDTGSAVSTAARQSRS